MLSYLRAPSDGRFSAAVTPGRNNPLTLNAEPVGDGFAFFVRLTPTATTTCVTCRWREIDPIATWELREMFDALQSALVAPTAR
ncbi:hypothetical protein ABZS95_17460 [Streptomyces sp. NPDC005479]|uniref:hypothetical protein n=1 Tax=unclassified Streptomyces TaxID=2593676 RepID=UPI0033AFF1A1